MDLGLKGLRGLVAGGSQGLGFATALELAREGARVVINGRDPRRLAEAAGKIQEMTEMKMVAVREIEWCPVDFS